MFNYKIYVAPEVYHKKSDWSYYYPEKTLSYQQPQQNYLETTQKNQNQYYNEQNRLQSKDQNIYTLQKESYHDIIGKMNKNLDFDFQSLKNKIDQLSISYLEERELFTKLIYELSDQLIQIEKCKTNITFCNLNNFQNIITVNDLLEYLYLYEFQQIRKCDIELFFHSISHRQSKDSIMKINLKNILGKEEIKNNNLQEDNQILFIQARIIAMIIQTYTLLEQYRQKFEQLCIKLDLIYNWLDCDRDGILTIQDFTKRYQKQEQTFNFLTQTSLRLNDFIILFTPCSKAKFL